MYSNLTFFFKECEEAILESVADLNLRKEKDENKAGGNSDQVINAQSR